jgi:uncharacterized protein (TIGR03790 family)
MRAVLCCVLAFSLVPVARGELKPDEVALIAMSTSPRSRDLAEYYAEARGIPTSHILYLRGRPGNPMRRETWEQKTRPTIRGWLADNKLEEKIRCFVTCWDVPLRIGPRSERSPVVIARKAYLAEARAEYVAQFAELIGALESLPAGGGDPPERRSYEPEVPLDQLAKEFDGSAKALRKRIALLTSRAETKQAAAAFERILAASGGSAPVLALVAKQGKLAQVPTEARLRLELAKGKLQGLQQGLAALGSLPDSVARDVQILSLLQQTSGVLGAIRWIDRERELLKKNETHASFDSELSLLHWPDYPLFRWSRNPLHYAFSGISFKRPTLMVCRLAAPKEELVRKLIDTSIAVEKKGPAGKFYLDARGLAYNPTPDKPGGYGQYDQSIRDLAERLKDHTDLEVVLDNRSELFGPGDCPDAALYCGWYSFARYVDAFDWNPGAVGYHIASGEATRLLAPGNPVWCNAMLEDGITATLGPVAEPYLAAFPLPDDFFSLLLTGRYSLVETYYRTKPFNSWQMVLVGDPLYNPFKNRPLLDESQLPERMRPKTP